MADTNPLTSDNAMSLTRERCRRVPRGVLAICSACALTGREYFVLMDTHKRDARAGLIWCSQCYEGLKGRRYSKGHLGGNPDPKKGGASLALQKPGQGASSSGSLSDTTCAGTTFANFPTLWEFLTLSRWPDATLRSPGTIILFVEGDKWKCCVKDPNGRRVAFVTGKDLDSLLLAVDGGLDADDLDWRPDRPQGGQGKKLS